MGDINADRGNTHVDSFVDYTIFRTTRPEMFFRKGVLINFAKFAEKHLCFPVNFAKFLKTPPVAASES